MNRPKPSKKLLTTIFQEDRDLASTAYFGLHEVSLSAFYPLLNFEEAIAFAVASRAIREKSRDYLLCVVERAPVHEIFRWVLDRRIWRKYAGYRNIWDWLSLDDKLRESLLSPQFKSSYQKLNPFSEEQTLKERLAEASPEAVQELRNNLSALPFWYTSEAQHYWRHREQKDTTHYRPLIFQPFSFQKFERQHGSVLANQKIIERYAGQIRKMLVACSQEYAPFTQEPPRNAAVEISQLVESIAEKYRIPDEKEPEQLELDLS